MTHTKIFKKVFFLSMIPGLIWLLWFPGQINAQEGAQPEGYVIRVTETGDIYIDLGEMSGVRTGTKISIYKQGEEITHPITKQVLRGGEILVGEIEVEQVGLDYSIARTPSPDLRESIKVGDLVRLPLNAQIQIGEGSEGQPLTVGRSNIDTELIYVSYGSPERAYSKESIEFWYRFPSRTRNTMSIMLGQDGYLTPKGKYFWYGLGAWVLDSFLFDVDLSLMFGAAFSTTGIGGNFRTTIGDEDDSNLQIEFRGITNLGGIGRGQLNIKVIDDLRVFSEVRYEDLGVIEQPGSFTDGVFVQPIITRIAKGLRLSFGAKYDIVENLALSLQAGPTTDADNRTVGFLAGLNTSLKF